MRQGLVMLLAVGTWSDAARADGLLSAEGRAVLGAEIRALLLEEPEVLEPALNPPSAFEDAVNADLSRLETLAPRLFDADHEGFGPKDAALQIALFIRDDCADCGQAEADLQALAVDHDLRVTLHRMDDNNKGAELAEALELTEAPSYVLPDMMLQGHMPPVVLDRYLSR
jgi:hypothetical protein